jgi:glutamyl-tRNA synthetase
VLIYQAFGWDMPAFAHVPAVLRQDGRGKLSKRKDDVATNRFWERGYLPDTMFNYLALQGWSYDDHTEIMSRAELVERFSLDRVQSSPARWNPDKLKDMNGIYIRNIDAAELAALIAPYLSRAELIGDPPTADEMRYLQSLVPLIHERLEELQEAPELLEFFFRPISYADPAMLIPKKMDAAKTVQALEAAQQRLQDLPDWNVTDIETSLRELVAELGLKAGQLFGAIRVAITGRTVAPPLFDTLVALGAERSLQRLGDARTTVTQKVDYE